MYLLLRVWNCIFVSLLLGWIGTEFAFFLLGRTHQKFRKNKYHFILQCGLQLFISLSFFYQRERVLQSALIQEENQVCILFSVGWYRISAELILFRIQSFIPVINQVRICNRMHMVLILSSIDERLSSMFHAKGFRWRASSFWIPFFLEPFYTMSSKSNCYQCVNRRNRSPQCVFYSTNSLIGSLMWFQRSIRLWSGPRCTLTNILIIVLQLIKKFFLSNIAIMAVTVSSATRYHHFSEFLWI